MHKFPLPQDYWIVDPKYIFDVSTEETFVAAIKKSFIESEPLKLILELLPGTKTEVIAFRPYAGAQTYIYTKADQYFKDLPCTSSFLIVLPYNVAAQLPKFKPTWGVTLPKNPDGFTIKNSKLFSEDYAIKSFEVE
jgi:hypothetical protein